MKFRCPRLSRRSQVCDLKEPIRSEIQWEVRPGGMLVQKRGTCRGDDGYITVRVYNGEQCHNINIQQTHTFEELKVLLSMVTSLDPPEQRLLFRGKEREDSEHLHMVGIRDKDKLILLQDPAIKERKKLLANGLGRGGAG